MLTYDLHLRGNAPLYDYLYRQIRDDILAGRLAAGEKLPSKRALAGHLHVGVVTVETAYAQLVAEGYLESRERQGYFVVAQLSAAPLAPPSPSPQTLLTPPQESPFLLDLQTGGTSAEGFPFSVWAKLMRRTISQQGDALLRSPPHNGALLLRQAIAEHLSRFRGVLTSPDQIVVGAGTEHLCSLLVQLLGRELRYAVEDPGYPKPAQVFQLESGACRFLPVDQKGISFQALSKSDAQVIHLSPSHQFPTGAVTPIVRRQALLRWAAQQPGRFLIEDDYDSEFRFSGRPMPTLQSIDRGGRVIYLNTFSRALAPSLRVSYLVLPPELAREYTQKLGFYSCTVPAMEQYTLARFLSGGGFETHVNRMRVFYRGRRDQVLSALEESPLKGRYAVRGEDAGLHFLVGLDTRRSDRELARLAQEAGIRLSFLTDYGGGEEHWLVVNYPGADLERLPQALERLAVLL